MKNYSGLKYRQFSFTSSAFYFSFVIPPEQETLLWLHDAVSVAGHQARHDLQDATPLPHCLLANEISE